MSFKIHEYEFEVNREKKDYCHQFNCYYGDDLLAVLDIYPDKWYLYLYTAKKLWTRANFAKMADTTISNDNKALTAKTVVLNHILNLIGQDAF